MSPACVKVMPMSSRPSRKRSLVASSSGNSASMPTAGALIVHYALVTRERRHLRNLFSRFVPPDVAGTLRDAMVGVVENVKQWGADTPTQPSANPFAP